MSEHVSTDGKTDEAESYLSTWTSSPAQWFTRADGSRLRYIVAGDGPPLVLLHTVRTQLDYFQRVIPLLASAYRVYAVDFPGMGWSDIVPDAGYGEADLRQAVVEFVERLDLQAVTLVGESMGSVIALTASTVLGGRVTRVVASNTYDYKPGLERSNILARFIIPAVRAPFVGPTFAALENRAIVKGIVSGGYADTSRLPEPFLDELVRVGGRSGYSTVARAIYRNLDTLIASRKRYLGVTVPVELIYSEDDWSRQPDREATATALGHPPTHLVQNAGHFLAMERPEMFAAIVLKG